MNKNLLTLFTSIILFILGIFLIAGLSCKEEAPLIPKMTAPEVCQYVNQALPDEYEYIVPPVIRYEYRYTAINAQYRGKPQDKHIPDEEMNRIIKGLSPEALRIFKQELLYRLRAMNPQDREATLSRLRGIEELEDIITEFEGVLLEGTWLVSVNVIAEPQRFIEGRWVATPLYETKTHVQYYYFYETTGAVIKR